MNSEGQQSNSMKQSHSDTFRLERSNVSMITCYGSKCRKNQRQKLRESLLPSSPCPLSLFLAGFARAR